MADRAGNIIWPGLLYPKTVLYTLSHGISPGCAVIKAALQPNLPEMSGDLIITDNFGTIKIPDCKIDKVRQEESGDGFVNIYEILDWRWKWRDTGSISGSYNQLDPHGKLIPWTIRSPHELALLCFQALGVKKYEMDLPLGLNRAQGEAFASLNPPWIGVIPTTGTNPSINWVNERPAQALESLAELFGRRVVARLSDYTMTIVLPGRGAELPAGAIATSTPTLDSPETPSGVGVIGDPTRYQVRLLLEPVGEDWDGSFRHINHLSYTPELTGTGAAQISTVSIAGFIATNDVFTVTINDVTFSHTATAGQTATDVAAALVVLIAANPGISAILTASSSGPTITLTGITQNVSFTVVTTPSSSITSMLVSMTQVATGNRKGWENEAPGTYWGAIATDRLTKTEAIELAQKSVWRMFRLADIGPGTPLGWVTNGSNVGSNGQPIERPRAPIPIPGYGTLKRRQQIVLEDTQVEQIQPNRGDLNLLNANLDPIIMNHYNGYSRDKAAAVYGSHAVTSIQAFFANNSSYNTPEGSIVTIPFSIDPINQLVVFSNYVMFWDGNRCLDPGLILQTGVLIRNAETNELECFRRGAFLVGVTSLSNVSGVTLTSRGLASETAFSVRKYPDVQLNVIGEYDSANNPTGSQLLEQDAIVRADYYIRGMAAQYFATNAEIRSYQGIVPTNLDGAIMQATWQIDDKGWSSTVVSRNTEHAVYVPPYPARRRAEFQRPVDQQNTLNAADPARGGFTFYRPPQGGDQRPNVT